jgi:hypothetical protein
MAKIIAYKELDQRKFKIEKNVPCMPWIERKYPFNSMEVGDSFLIPDPTPEDIKKIRSAASVYGTRYKKKFSTQRDSEKLGSYRCWRTK